MSLELEKEMIGLLLTGTGDRYYSVADRLKPDHFVDVTMRSLYTAIQRVHEKKTTFSLPMVESEVLVNPNDVIIMATLAVLKSKANEQVDEVDISDSLIDEWYRRTFVDTVQNLPKLVKKDLFGEALVEAGVAALVEPFDDEETDDSFDMGTMAKKQIQAQSIVDTGGFYSGVDFIDRICAPFLPGQLIVVGGQTSSGKSALVQMLAWKLASIDISSYFITNEMSGQDTAARATSQMSGIPIARILEPWTMQQSERELAEDTTDKLLSYGIKGMDRAKPTVAFIRLKVKKAKRKHNIKAVMIDHLQFIAPENPRDKPHEQLDQITKDLKALAKECKVTIVLISHIKRADEFKPIKRAKDIKRPRLNDLFGSSAIEKAGDVVFFVHRPYYFLERNEPIDQNAASYFDWKEDMQRWKGRAEIINAKRRQGKGAGIEEIMFNDETTLFHSRNVDPNQEELI